MEPSLTSLDQLIASQPAFAISWESSSASNLEGSQLENVPNDPNPTHGGRSRHRRCPTDDLGIRFSRDPAPGRQREAHLLEPGSGDQCVTEQPDLPRWPGRDHTGGLQRLLGTRLAERLLLHGGRGFPLHPPPPPHTHAGTCPPPA